MIQNSNPISELNYQLFRSRDSWKKFLRQFIPNRDPRASKSLCKLLDARDITKFANNERAPFRINDERQNMNMVAVLTPKKPKGLPYFGVMPVADATRR